MRLALALAGLAFFLALGLLLWGPLPKQSRTALRILRARVALGLASADTRYRIAEHLFQQADFEGALLQCQIAMRRSPGHAPARALFTEIQYLLGMGSATSYPVESSATMKGWLPPQQLLNEVDQALVRADRHRMAGNLQEAKLEVRKIREYLKWFPSGGELDARGNEVQILSDRLAREGSADD